MKGHQSRERLLWIVNNTISTRFTYLFILRRYLAKLIMISLGIFHVSMTAVKSRALFVIKYYSCQNNGPVILPQLNLNKFTQLPFYRFFQIQLPSYLILVIKPNSADKDLHSLNYFQSLLKCWREIIIYKSDHLFAKTLYS